jgi:hypothetical protein
MALADAQKNTPPWARGVPWRRWVEERGWVWDKGEAERHMEDWHASGQCRKPGKRCEWCAKREGVAA